MAGKSLHFYPEENRTVARADFVDCLLRRVVNLLHIVAFDLTPVVRLKRIERERIRIASIAADAVGVVLNDKKHRQFFLFGKADCFKKITLARGGVANRSDDKIFFAVEFNPPGDAACGKKLRAGRRRHAPDVMCGVAVMRRHLTPTASGIALGKVLERQLTRAHATAEHETAIAIVRNDIIVRPQ